MKNSDVASPSTQSPSLQQRGSSGSAHTPGPWRHHDTESATLVSRDGFALADFGAKSRMPAVNQANADFALRAVNSHDDLLAALKELVAASDAYDESEDADLRCAAAIVAAKEAIAKAEAA